MNNSGHTEPMTESDASGPTWRISPNEPQNNEVTFQPRFEEAAHMEKTHPKEVQA